jgi:hypothetical protein
MRTCLARDAGLDSVDTRNFVSLSKRPL